MTVFEDSNISKQRFSPHKPGGYPEEMDSSGSELLGQSSPPTSHQAWSAQSARVAPHHKQKWNQNSITVKNTKTSRAPAKTTPQRHRKPAEEGQLKEMIREISTETPITQHQLVTEVKSIYSGLVVVESKCIAVQEQQAALLNDENHPRLNEDQLKALIALHRVYLHEHHDFMLASQHPSASPALKALVSKYSMIARMWRHGIHGLLELFRHRLSYSREYMVEYIYIAYSIMAELYEQMPMFEPVWSECLGDLSRYRMAVTDSNDEDRAVWVEVSKYWYGKGIDNNPACGRLYHHIAVVAGQNPLEQLFLFEKSLCVPTGFEASRVSLSKTLFDRESRSMSNSNARFNSLGESFIHLHKLLFAPETDESFDAGLRIYLNLLECRANRTTPKFLQQASQIAISSIFALTEFGRSDIASTKGMSDEKNGDAMKGLECADANVLSDDSDGSLFSNSQRIFFDTAATILEHVEDPNINGFAHVILTFLLHISQTSSSATTLFSRNGDLEYLLSQLTTLLNHNLHRLKPTNINNIESADFPSCLSESDSNSDNVNENCKSGPQPQPLSEDLEMRGLNWLEPLLPDNWFHSYDVAEGYSHWEVCGSSSRTEEHRRERIVWLGLEMARSARKGGCNYFEFDEQKRLFSPVSVSSFGRDAGRHMLN